MSITRAENPPEPDIDLEDYFDDRLEYHLGQGLSGEDAEIEATNDCQAEHDRIMECRGCCPGGVCRGYC